MGETVDAKAEEEGLGVESIVVGIACDRLAALGCGESNGVCLLYDITDISSPSILKILHLSEASRTKNPEQSYLKDLGDIDSETILWIPPSRSPTGNSGFLFGGRLVELCLFMSFSVNFQKMHAIRMDALIASAKLVMKAFLVGRLQVLSWAQSLFLQLLRSG
jgi:hypothetical protein